MAGSTPKQAAQPKPAARAVKAVKTAKAVDANLGDQTGLVKPVAAPAATAPVARRAKAAPGVAKAAAQKKPASAAKAVPAVAAKAKASSSEPALVTAKPAAANVKARAAKRTAATLTDQAAPLAVDQATSTPASKAKAKPKVEPEYAPGMASPFNPDGMPVSELLALLQANPQDERALAVVMHSANITYPESRQHVASWKTLGPTIAAAPQLSLAAWLGHAPAIALLESQGLAVPTAKVFARDPALKPDPYGLGLSRDEKAMALFTRCVAFWGPQALQRAALACAELQLSQQNQCPADLLPLRDAAMDAARRRMAALSDTTLDEAGAKAARQGTRKSAKAAAEACWARWETHKNPDSAAATKTWKNLGAPWFAAALIGNSMKLQDYDGEPPRVASSSWGARNTTDLGRAAEVAQEWTSHAQTLGAMQDALLAWALGNAKPKDFA